MTATEKPHEFGLLIARARNVCNEIRITVSIQRRDDTGKSILNVSDRDTASWDDRCPKRHHGRTYQDLVMEGQVYTSSSDGNILIADEPRYRSVYSLELTEAERIVKTLKAFGKTLEKHRATMKAAGHDTHISPAAMLALFAKFVDAKFMVFRDYAKDLPRGPYHSDEAWNFLTLEEGLNVYRQQVEKLCADYVDPWKKRSAA